MASSAIGATLAHAMLPTGSLVDFAGTSAPSGWLMCDGREVSRTAYSSLFAIVGTSYGVGDGSTTFNLPDFRGRFARYNDNMNTAEGAAGRDTGRTHGSEQGQATKRPNTAFTASSSSVSVSGNKNQLNHGHTFSGNGVTLHGNGGLQVNTVAVGDNNSGGYGTYTPSGTVNSVSFGGTFSASGTAAGQTITGGGDVETRPVNLACNRIIKY